MYSLITKNDLMRTLKPFSLLMLSILFSITCFSQRTTSYYRKKGARNYSKQLPKVDYKVFKSYVSAKRFEEIDKMLDTVYFDYNSYYNYIGKDQYLESFLSDENREIFTFFQRFSLVTEDFDRIWEYVMGVYREDSITGYNLAGELYLVQTFSKLIYDLNINEIEKFLLENPHMINARFYFNETPMHYVFGKVMRKSNKLEEIYQMAEFLLRKGARCSGYTSRMEHPVYLAACNYPAKFMDLIFKYYPDLQYDQWVLLKNAIKNNDKSTLDWLIDNEKIDYKKRDQYGNGIMHYVIAQNAYLIPRLIEKGVDPNMVNDQNETALLDFLSDKKSYLPENVDLSLFDLNIASSYQMTPLLFLASYNGQRYAEQLIKAGANVNYASSKNASPLLSAIKEKNVEMVKILVDNGADVKLAPDGWLPPIKYAKKLKSGGTGVYDDDYDKIILLLKKK